MYPWTIVCMQVMADFSSAKSLDKRFRSVVRTLLSLTRTLTQTLLSRLRHADVLMSMQMRTLLSRGSRADSRLRDALTRLEEIIPLMQVLG